METFRAWFHPMRRLSLALWLISALEPLPSFADQIPLQQEHGVYMVPVRINQTVSIPFILDRAVIDFVKGQVFDPADYIIRADGVCRLNPEMARMVLAKISA
jgi:hypothetical protein